MSTTWPVTATNHSLFCWNGSLMLPITAFKLGASGKVATKSPTAKPDFANPAALAVAQNDGLPRIMVTSFGILFALLMEFKLGHGVNFYNRKQLPEMFPPK